jgi:hypothetical protein
MLSKPGMWLGTGGIGYRSGSQAIANGASIVSVLFSSNMPNTNFAIIYRIANYTDVSPMTNFGEFGSIKAIGGFTVDWDNNVDSGSYVLEWLAIQNQ